MPIEAEALNLFLENVAVALRQMERDPPYSAKRLLGLVHARIPVSCASLPNATPSDRDSILYLQLGHLAMSQTFVETLPGLHSFAVISPLCLRRLG